MPINFTCDKILDMAELVHVAEPQPKPNQEEVVGKPNFAGRLVEIKKSAKAHVQKSIQLLNPEIPQEKPQEPVTALTPEDVLNQLEALGKDETLSPEDFLSQSKQILQASDEIIHLTVTQKVKLEDQAYPLRSDLEKHIDPKIQTLNHARGIRKFFARGEKGRLTTQKSNMQSQLAELEEQMQAKKQFIDQIVMQQGSVYQKQEKALRITQDTLMTAVGQEIAAIRSDYEHLLEEILQDGTMLSDIRETFIEQIITPEVDTVPKAYTGENKKEEFYKALRTYIDHGEEPNIRSSDHAELLRSFRDGNHAIYLAEPLLDGQDKEIIKLLVEEIAAQDTAPIRIAAESQWGNYPSKNKFQMILEKALKPKAKPYGFHQPKYVRFCNKIQLWQGVKYSSKANELFGNEIEIQDQQYYHDVLEKSVSSDRDNTEAAQSLYYYPTPDTIRNLVLIASAFSTDHQDNRLNPTNVALAKLSARKNWPDILDNATKVYPSLNTARPILEKWTELDSFSNRHPKIQDAVQDFALSILDSKPADQRLTGLAKNALTNGSILDVLAKRGTISNSDAENLKEAERILLQENQQNSSRYHIDEYYLRITLKKVLSPLLHQQEEITADAKTQIKRLATLSQEIIKAGDTNTYVFDLAMASPDIFLQTDEGLMFLQEFSKKGLDLLDPSLNLSFGQKFFKQTKDLSDGGKEIKLGLSKNEFTRTDKLLTANPELEINEGNWRSLLMTFVESQTGNHLFSDESINRVKELFKNPHVKDFCLNNFRKEYVDYLANGNFDQIPFTLYLTTEYIKYAGGAGPFTQIESLSNFVSVFCASLGKETTTEESRNAVLQGMHALESRFDKEKWSNENRTDFYNVSSDILNADPNLFSDFIDVFDKLNPSELKRFMRETYSLYGVQLALMEKTDKDGKKTYDTAQLLNLRKGVQDFSESIKTQEKPLEAQKAKLIGEISRLFETRFGIIKVPQEFTEENIRSLTNVSLYLVNLSARDAAKETELGYYLSLMLNDKWNNFRRGETVDPKEFLDSKRAETIADTLKKRTDLNVLTSRNLGVQESDMPEFLRILQEETQNVAVGDIETVDVKLNNVILNLRQLEDPDLYPEPLDKERMKLLLSYGNRKVGAAVAKMYQSTQSTSRSIQLSEEETKIQEEIRRIAKENSLELTTENIKKHFQEGIRPLSTIVNMLQFVDETRAEVEIESLRQILQPSSEIMDVFNRLGEEFKPTSGALALSQDLDYLDNIIVKKEASLNPNEKMLLSNYTGTIRIQVVKLQGIFDQIKNKFSSLKQGNTTSNQLLIAKLEQIDKIVNAPPAQQTVASTMTNNLNTIIENMRACLSCTTKGANNDTNLTFGDLNKFYLYSQSEGQAKGSISDEVLFLEPVAHQDGTSEMAFVFDRIYGVQTPTILTNQLETVIKKYKQLKQKFPRAKLSIFVTDSAISTAGLSSDMLRSRIQNTMGNNTYAEEEEVGVDVAESAMADHYIEFGGNSRTSGKRQVKGLVIRL